MQLWKATRYILIESWAGKRRRFPPMAFLVCGSLFSLPQHIRYIRFPSLWLLFPKSYAQIPQYIFFAHEDTIDIPPTDIYVFYNIFNIKGVGNVSPPKELRSVPLRRHSFFARDNIIVDFRQCIFYSESFKLTALDL